MEHAPSRENLLRIADVRDPWCVTIYGDIDAWARGGHATEEALRQVRAVGHELESAGAPGSVVDEFGQRLAAAAEGDGDTDVRGMRGVAVLATSGTTQVLPLPTAPAASVTVTDRYRIAPLVEAMLSVIPPVLVLALSENEARLVDVTPYSMGPVKVPGMPDGARRALRLDLGGDRETAARAQIAVQPKERLHEYARMVRDAVEPVVVHHRALLVLAVAEPLAGIYRAEAEYPLTAEESIPGDRDHDSLDKLAAAAAPIADRERRRRTRRELERFAVMPSRGLGLTETAEVVSALRSGAVATLLVDPDRQLPVPAQAFSREVTLDLVDEAVRRALSTSADIVCVEPGDLPAAQPLAAILRYQPEPRAPRA